MKNAFFLLAGVVAILMSSCTTEDINTENNFNQQVQDSQARRVAIKGVLRDTTTVPFYIYSN